MDTNDWQWGHHHFFLVLWVSMRSFSNLTCSARKQQKSVFLTFLDLLVSSGFHQYFNWRCTQNTKRDPFKWPMLGFSPPCAQGPSVRLTRRTGSCGRSSNADVPAWVPGIWGAEVINWGPANCPFQKGIVIFHIFPWTSVLKKKVPTRAIECSSHTIAKKSRNPGWLLVLTPSKKCESYFG